MLHLPNRFFPKARWPVVFRSRPGSSDRSFKGRMGYYPGPKGDSRPSPSANEEPSLALGLSEEFPFRRRIPVGNFPLFLLSGEDLVPGRVFSDLGVVKNTSLFLPLPVQDLCGPTQNELGAVQAVVGYMGHLQSVD